MWSFWIYVVDVRKIKVKVKVAQLYRLLATPWTVACQAPLSMEFSRQEYWKGNLSLLQRIFPTQGLNLRLSHCRQILYCLSHQGSLVVNHFT